MKSLKESLFDSEKNITKDMTFGDLFKFESFSMFYMGGSYPDLSKTFSVGRIKKITKIQGKDNNETIYKGLVQIIQDISITGDPDDWGHAKLQAVIRDKVEGLFKQSISNIYKNMYVGFYRNEVMQIKYYSLFDPHITEIDITIGPDLNLKFIRK